MNIYFKMNGKDKQNNKMKKLNFLSPPLLKQRIQLQKVF